MARYDTLDVCMKILEIIERDLELEFDLCSPRNHAKLLELSEKIRGNVVLQQIIAEEVTMEGDRFENIQNSLIATRGSIARGCIHVQEVRGAGVADAIKELDQAIALAKSITPAEREEALELLAEITKKSATPEPSKGVLKTLGTALWGILQKSSNIKDVVQKVWSIIEALWT